MVCRRAFTLVELLTVLVILAIIGGVAVSKFYDQRVKALRSAEEATARIVRAGISQYITSNAVTGWAKPPAALDSSARSVPASSSNALFGLVLGSGGVTSEWTTGSVANSYVGPAGTTFYYDPATGAFTTDLTAIAAAQAAAAATTQVAVSLTNAAVYTAGSPNSPVLGPGVMVGSGYALVNGVIELTDPNATFSEAGRRTVMTGQAIEAGTFDLALDTRLSNYYNQLNYWQVYLVKNGTDLQLQGNALNWGSAPAGTKLVSQDYAPANMSDGNFYTYGNSFTVSAADAAAYDQIVVIMAGTKGDGQVLSWRNVSITKK